MSHYFVLNKQLTSISNNKSSKNTSFGFNFGDVLILYMINKHLPSFGGINFDKYRYISKGIVKNEFMYLPNPIEGYFEHKGGIWFDQLNKEDFNRLTYAFLKGAEEFVKSTFEDYSRIIKQYYTDDGPIEEFEANQFAIKEAIPKFKADPRYNPEWKYDPNVKNDEEIIYDLDEVVRLRELKDGKESKE